MVREHIARIINKESDMEVCGEADNIQQALEIIQQTAPHLAVVDITLNGNSGLELIKSMKVLSIPVPVLVLSMHDESIYAERAFRAGAQGYITKQQQSREILAAMRRVLEGKMYLSETMVESVLRKFVPGGIKNMKYRSVDRLSERELMVLEMIGHGHTSRAIAETLDLGIATVETYRMRIKQKLNLRNTVELQHFAIEWLCERG